MKSKKLKKFVLTLIVLFSLFFIATEVCIMKYLKEYGYGIKELPQTTMVYFRLSNGFTVGETDSQTIFIGRSDYIYDKLFEKNGYYEADRMAMDGFYSKIGEIKENNHTYDFLISSSDDWCHWFRIYYIGKKYPIESFR
ncbi:MAG: hypothetical protein K2K16_07560 [Ruminococcus sp.]|nr:hypothetical protein [Ruminococcus sp.]